MICILYTSDTHFFIIDFVTTDARCTRSIVCASGAINGTKIANTLNRLIEVTGWTWTR